MDNWHYVGILGMLGLFFFGLSELVRVTHVDFFDGVTPGYTTYSINPVAALLMLWATILMVFIVVEPRLRKK
jgi:hypothetical protein